METELECKVQDDIELLSLLKQASKIGEDEARNISKESDPKLFYCLNIITNHGNNICMEFLEEQLGFLFPSLTSADYCSIVQEWGKYMQEYRYGESNPGLQDENLLS